MSSATADPSTAVTGRCRAASSRAFRPVPQAKSKAGPLGSKGISSATKLAGSAAGCPAAPRCRSSQAAKSIDKHEKGSRAKTQEPGNYYLRSELTTVAKPNFLNAER